MTYDPIEDNRQRAEVLRDRLEEQIERLQAQDALELTPTPEQLVAWLNASQRKDVGSANDREIAMARVVRLAERGGDAHMKAVVEWVSSLPMSPTAPPAPTYEMRDGQLQPSFFGSNITLELRVRLGSRLFTARGAVDPFMFEHQFKGDNAQFEDYLRWFIQSNFGRIATADAESYAYFRSLLWVVHPTDPHDLRRCAESGDVSVWPSCFNGVMLSTPSNRTGGSPHPVAVCPCRCHKTDGSAEYAQWRARSLHLPEFDEDKL